MAISVIQPNFTRDQLLVVASNAYHHPMGPGTGTMISFHGWTLKGELDRSIREAAMLSHGNHPLINVPTTPLRP